MNLVVIAARNALRNKVRTSLTVLGVAVTVIAFILLRTVVGCWFVGAENAAKDRLATRHKVSFSIPLPKRHVEVVRGVSGVRHACYASWFGGKDPRAPNEYFATIAIEDACLEVLDEVAMAPEARQAWLADKSGVIVGDVLARKLGVKPGDRITLSGTVYPGDWQFTVRAIYTATRPSVDRSQFYLHWDYLNESIPASRRDRIGYIVSRVDDASRGPAVSAEIDRIFSQRDVPTATISERAMNLSFMATLAGILGALDAVSAVILVIMTMILGNTIAMGVRERTHEYGILRAVGFQPRHIALLVVSEAATFGAVAGAAGIGLAVPLVEGGMGRFVAENMGSFFPYFRIAPSTLAVALALAVTASIVASVLPAYLAARIPVTDALRRTA